MIGRVIAFVNYENDFENEFILLSNDQKSISIHNYKTKQIRELDTLTLLGGPLPSDEYIVNAIPADFNNDGYLDIALVITKLSSAGTEDSSFLLLGLGNGTTVSATGRQRMPIGLPQPFVADLSASLLPTLIGYRSGVDQLVSFTFNSDFSAPPKDSFDFITKPLLLDSKGPEVCRLAHPHSSAFVDLNGDCLADLFFFCQDEKTRKLFIQIWTANLVLDYAVQHSLESGDHYTFAHQYDLPPGAGQVSFSDMNADGTIDMVFAACPLGPSSCALHVLYNIQIPTCTEEKGPGLCRDARNLCTADSAFSFDFSSDQNHYQKSLKDAILGNQLVTSDDTFSGTLPLSLKIGDYNNDGFPDILLVVKVSGKRQQTAQILESKASHGGTRDFQLVYTGMDKVSTIKTVLGAAFIDQNNDGALDLLLIYQPTSSSNSNNPPISYTIFLNKFFFDAFFFKTLVLNGVCLGDNNNDNTGGAGLCPSISHLIPTLHPNITHLSSKPYGVNSAGASLKFSVTDPKGRHRTSQSVQLPQQAYQPLLSAWTVIGLGRTNNYLDDLFVGVSRREITSRDATTLEEGGSSRRRRHVSAYQGIIPNSAIVISPFEPAKSVEKIMKQGGGVEYVEDEDASSATWRLELYMNPSSTTSAIILVLVAVLFVLAGVIGILEVLEKREDYRERQEILHSLNFDAL